MGSHREIAKQFAVGLGMTILFPLVVWYATTAFRPPPDTKQHINAMVKLDDRIQNAKDEDEKEKLRLEKDQADKDAAEAERAYFAYMFWIAYPVGLCALVLGMLFRVQSIGAGFMFGGMFTLGAGCYAYWDRMGDWLRLGSLAVALVILTVLGTWRFLPGSSDESPAPR